MNEPRTNTASQPWQRLSALRRSIAELNQQMTELRSTTEVLISAADAQDEPAMAVVDAELSHSSPALTVVSFQDHVVPVQTNGHAVATSLPDTNVAGNTPAVANAATVKDAQPALDVAVKTPAVVAVTMVIDAQPTGGVAENAPGVADATTVAEVKPVSPVRQHADAPAAAPVPAAIAVPRVNIAQPDPPAPRAVLAGDPPKHEVTAAAAVKRKTISKAAQRSVERLGLQVKPASAVSAGSVFVGGSMEILEYWKIIRKRLWLLILLMLIGGASTAYYTSQLPPRYSSTTTLFLNPAAANTIVTYQADGLAALAATYAEFLKTSSFATDVVRDLNVPQLDEGAILGSLSTQYIAQTQFFRITATYGDPQLAQRLASSAAKVLIAKNIARQQEQQEQIRQQTQPNPDRDQLMTVRTTLQTQLDLYDGQITTLQAQLNRLGKEPSSDEIETQVLDIQERMVNLQSLRQSALTGLADAQAALANSADISQPNLDTAVVVDAAPLPAAPLPSRLVETTLIALLSALAVGAILAFLLEYIDYTVKTPEALDAIYGMPAQGVIGLAASKRGQVAGDYQLVTVNDTHSPVAEAFRALRTSVQVAGMSEPIRSLLITSAGPGEGKTFVAANLAVSLAQNGLRVILVDADLRRPRVHQVFNLSRETGLTNLIVSQPASLAPALRPQVRMIFERADNHTVLQRRYQDSANSGKPKLPFDRLGEFLREVESDDPEVLASVAELRRALTLPDEPLRYLQDTPVENLRVLACGPIPPNPAELLGSLRAAQVMEVLEDYADIVIYDSPPAATVTDAIVLASKVDAVLQVVRAGVTRIDVLRKCRALLVNVGARMLGPVLNQVRNADMGYYSNYYAYGYYSDSGDKGGKRKGKRKGKPNQPVRGAAAQKQDVISANALAEAATAPTLTNNHYTGTNGKLPVEDKQLIR